LVGSDRKLTENSKFQTANSKTLNVPYNPVGEKLTTIAIKVFVVLTSTVIVFYINSKENKE